MKKVTILCILLLTLLGAARGEKLYRETAPLPHPRQMHGAVVLGDYIYVLGGNHPVDGYMTTVYKAMVNADGTLGRWSNTIDLPQKRSYIENSTFVLNDICYVAGGMDGENVECSNTILWTRPKANGDLEPWRESPPYPGKGIHCSVAVSTPGYIHVIAGLFADDTLSNKVWSARIAPDGNILGWEQGPPLPTTLWYHCGAVSGGKVWIWGGLTTRDDKSVNNIIYVAPILSSGKLGPWSSYPVTLPAGFYAASSTVSGPFLISFCPRYAGRIPSNDIWYSRVSPQGITPWKRIKTELPSRLYIGLATDYRRGFVYIPGGRMGDKDEQRQVNPNVFLFKLRFSGKQEDGTDEARTMEAGANIAPSSHYSYMQHRETLLGDIPGFMNYEQARSIPGQPMLLYFHTSKATRCNEQNRILKDFRTDLYSGKLKFAAVDTVKFPQIAQQYGVFRVPCWLYFDAGGSPQARKYGIMKIPELQGVIQRIVK